MLLKNAKISTGVGNDTKTVHIVIEGEKIAEILEGDVPIAPCEEIIDARGLLVLPGAIDPHVHFDTPGYIDREDFTCGSRAAAAGGVTCVIDMPDTSMPPVTDSAKLKTKLSEIEKMSVIDFALWGGVSGNSFRSGDWQRRMKGLKKAGVVGFKTYLLSGMRTFEHLFPLELVEVMRFAKEIDALVGLHAEDRERAARITAEMQTCGRFDVRAYCESRRDPVEHDGIRQGISIAAETGASLHVVHVGSGAGAEEALNVKMSGADITMETCAHFLAFNEDDFCRVGAILKSAPVVKTAGDSEILWRLLAEGGIDFIASDHAPAGENEKNTGSIWTDYAGMPGTELMFAYLLSEGYLSGRMSLARLLEVTSGNAAKRFGLSPKKGSIAKGSHADIIIVDPAVKWVVTGAHLHSKGKLTPFEGRTFKGKVLKTICRGRPVYDSSYGILVEPGHGKFIKREA